MASSTKIKLSLDVLGEYHRHGISTESAAMASDILQENHEMNHIFYNEDQFHVCY